MQSPKTSVHFRHRTYWTQTIFTEQFLSRILGIKYSIEEVIWIWLKYFSYDIYFLVRHLHRNALHPVFPKHLSIQNSQKKHGYFNMDKLNFKSFQSQHISYLRICSENCGNQFCSPNFSVSLEYLSQLLLTIRKTSISFLIRL